MNLENFIAIAEFLGDDMTDDQASKLMDDAKNELSISEIEILMNSCAGPFYSELSQYNGEMGGLSRY